MVLNMLCGKRHQLSISRGICMVLEYVMWEKTPAINKYGDLHGAEYVMWEKTTSYQ